jgi:hypothetical protein
MVFGISIPGKSPPKFLVLKPNPLVNAMIAIVSLKKYLDMEGFLLCDKCLIIDAMKGSLRRPPDIKGEVSPEKTEKGG